MVMPMHTAANIFHNHKNVKVYVLSISPVNCHDGFCHDQLCVCVYFLQVMKYCIVFYSGLFLDSCTSCSAYYRVLFCCHVCLHLIMLVKVINSVVFWKLP